MPDAIPTGGPVIYIDARAIGGDKSEGMQSLTVTFQSITLRATTDAFPMQPVGGLQINGKCAPYSLGGCAAAKSAIVNSGISRHSYWIPNTELSLNAPNGASTPQIDFEVHCVCHRIGEIVFSGAINSDEPGQSGLVVQVSGLLCDRVEFWARPRSDVGILPPYGPVRITINVIVDRLPGSGDLEANGVAIVLGAIATPEE